MERMDSRGEFWLCCRGSADWEVRFMHRKDYRQTARRRRLTGVADKSVRATRTSLLHELLRCLYLIPDFVVLGAARNILPEINSLLIFVHIVEMQILLLLWGH